MLPEEFQTAAAKILFLVFAFLLIVIGRATKVYSSTSTDIQFSKNIVSQNRLFIK